MLACQVPPFLLKIRRSLSWPTICRSERPPARALSHQPDHALFSLVFHQAAVLVVIAEGKLPRMGAVVAVFVDAASIQGRKHH